MTATCLAISASLLCAYRSDMHTVPWQRIELCYAPAQGNHLLDEVVQLDAGSGLDCQRVVVTGLENRVHRVDVARLHHSAVLHDLARHEDLLQSLVLDLLVGLDVRELGHDWPLSCN